MSKGLWSTWQRTRQRNLVLDTFKRAMRQGEGKGNLYLGIYELGENTRKLCFAPPARTGLLRSSLCQAPSTFSLPLSE
jgi:hypothetical protein